MARQIVDVEAGPVALRVGQAEAGERAVGAAIQACRGPSRSSSVCAEAPCAAKIDGNARAMLATSFSSDRPLPRASGCGGSCRIGHASQPHGTALQLQRRQCLAFDAPRFPAVDFRISERSWLQGQGVDARGRCGRICRRRRPCTGTCDASGHHGEEAARRPLKPETRLVTAGRDPAGHHGFVNPPVYHASTVLYPTAEDLVAHRGRYQYGRRGTPTSEALEDALRELEGPNCAGVALLPSGLAAISTALLCGRSVPATTSWSPTASIGRRAISATACSSASASTTTYYDPLIGAGIAALMQAEHPRGVRRGARLAVLRDAGHPGHRRGRARQGRRRADGQYLGDAALFPRPREWRRPRRSRPAPNISAAIPT